MGTETVKSWRDITGRFDFEDCYRRIVKAIPSGGKFVEIGVGNGKSIAAFIEFSKGAGIEVHVVDSFKDVDSSVEFQFWKNMEALSLFQDIIPHIEESGFASGRFIPGTVDAVFVNKGGNEEAVLAEITTWAPKVKVGSGIMAGFDIKARGVFAAVTRFFGTNYQTIGRCWWVEM